MWKMRLSVFAGCSFMVIAVLLFGCGKDLKSNPYDPPVTGTYYHAPSPTVAPSPTQISVVDGLATVQDGSMSSIQATYKPRTDGRKDFQVLVILASDLPTDVLTHELYKVESYMWLNFGKDEPILTTVIMQEPGGSITVWMSAITASTIDWSSSLDLQLSRYDEIDASTSLKEEIDAARK